MSVGASSQFPGRDRPFVGTGFVLLGLLLLILLFLGILMLGLFAGGTQVCSSGYQGPVTDASGNVIEQGHKIEETCTGSPVDWAAVGGFGALLALVGFGIFVTIQQVRRYANRWNSPIYYPIVWVTITGILLALVLYAVGGVPIIRTQSCDTYGACTAHDFQLLASLVLWVIIAVLAIPFALAVLRLVQVMRSQRAAH